MGRQSGNIYRLTVSIPVGLKERMDAADAPVNWSQVAARAFEEKLADITSMKKKEDWSLGDTIQRLRVSKLKSEDGEYEEGFHEGHHWARYTAEFYELKPLLEWLETPGGCDSDDFVEDGFTAEFWIRVLGDGSHKADNPLFVRGFAAGAMDLFNKIKDKL